MNARPSSQPGTEGGSIPQISIFTFHFKDAPLESAGPRVTKRVLKKRKEEKIQPIVHGKSYQNSRFRIGAHFYHPNLGPGWRIITPDKLFVRQLSLIQGFLNHNEVVFALFFSFPIHLESHVLAWNYRFPLATTQHPGAAFS